MDLETYRNTPLEQHRINNISKLLPRDARTVLDAGARDGYISLMLAKTFDSVTALDLNKPNVRHSKIHAVEGDITRLNYADRTFDLVLCTEVLEHLPTPQLRMACRELGRVTRRYVLVGVPYKQDLRVGRTTCYSCTKKNPPWSHLHSFTEQRVRAMFPDMEVESVTFVGSHRDRTNKLSTWLMDRAGNPYGTYDQEEPCIHCGKALATPPNRTFLQKVMTKGAVLLNRAQLMVARPQAHWIHVLLRKQKRPEYPTVVPLRDPRVASNVSRLSA